MSEFSPQPRPRLEGFQAGLDVVVARLAEARGTKAGQVAEGVGRAAVDAALDSTGLVKERKDGSRRLSLLGGAKAALRPTHTARKAVQAAVSAGKTEAKSAGMGLAVDTFKARGKSGAVTAEQSSALDAVPEWMGGSTAGEALPDWKSVDSAGSRQTEAYSGATPAPTMDQPPSFRDSAPVDNTPPPSWR